jgi:hypothetical protein
VLFAFLGADVTAGRIIASLLNQATKNWQPNERERHETVDTRQGHINELKGPTVTLARVIF